MAVSLPDARELSDEVLESLRPRALRGRELGLTETAVADLLGVRCDGVTIDLFDLTSQLSPRVLVGRAKPLQRAMDQDCHASLRSLLRTRA